MWACAYAALALVACTGSHASPAVERVSSVPVELHLSTIKARVIQRNATAGVEVVPGGRTRSQTIRKALGLVPGEEFRFFPERWAAIRNCDLYASVKAMADRTDDGIRVIVDAVERPSFSLEPSITKTLRSPDWMGDLTLEDKNWKGTAQKIAVSIRKRLEEDVPCFRIGWADRLLGCGSNIALDAYRDVTSMERTTTGLPWGDVAVLPATHAKQASLHALEVVRVAVSGLSFEIRPTQRVQNSMHSPPSLLGSLKAALQAVQVTASVFVEQLRTLETHTNIQQYKETQASSMTLSGGLLQVSTASPALSELTSVHTEAGNILTDFLRRTAYTVGATASRGILGAGLSLPFTSLTINAGLTRALPRIFSIPAHLMRKNVDNSESQAQIQTPVGSVECRAAHSWGAGCVPYYHSVPLGGSANARGYSNAELGLWPTVVSTTVALRSPPLLDAGAAFGVFAEAAIACAAQQQHQRLASVGCSLYLGRIRMDVAWPVRHALHHTQRTQLHFGLSEAWEHL